MSACSTPRRDRHPTSAGPYTTFPLTRVAVVTTASAVVLHEAFTSSISTHCFKHPSFDGHGQRLPRHAWLGVANLPLQECVSVVVLLRGPAAECAVRSYSSGEREREIYFKSHNSLWEHSSHFRLIGRGVPSVSVVSQLVYKFSVWPPPRKIPRSPYERSGVEPPTSHTASGCTTRKG